MAVTIGMPPAAHRRPYAVRPVRRLGLSLGAAGLAVLVIGPFASAMPLHEGNASVAGALQLSALDKVTTIYPATLQRWAHGGSSPTGAWLLVIERDLIAQAITEFAQTADRPAIRDGYKFVNGRVATVPGRDGVVIDVAAAVEQVSEVLTQRAHARRIGVLELATRVQRSGQGGAVAGDMTVMSEWTTRVRPSIGNGYGVNHRIAVKAINGTVVRPGQTFDFWRVVGAQTAAKGYVLGGALKNGRHIEQGALGGGACAVSTTLFNAALRAGLDLGPRRNHMFYFRRYPLGLDATVTNPGGLNMTFTNDTKYPIVIRGIWNKKGITFQLWSMPTGRKVVVSKPIVQNVIQPNYRLIVYSDELAPGTSRQVDPAGKGFDATVTRTVYENGRVLHRDVYRSHYRPLPAQKLVGRNLDDPAAGTVVKIYF
jgi:vancomycin resistance protein YoaR